MKSKQTHDEVNNPKHYDLFPDQQAIDIIQASLTEEEFAGYCKGNALKYRLRAGSKGDALKCIAKADWYQSKLWEGKRASVDSEEWPDETRIDVIGKNGNDGEIYSHYTLAALIGDAELSDWVRWVAVDRDGEVWIYSLKPTLSENGLWQPASHPDVRLKKLKTITPPKDYSECIWEIKK